MVSATLVLIVSADEPWATRLTDSLNAEGYEAVTVPDAAHARSPVAVVLDLSAVDAGGPTLAECLQRWPQVPVLVISSGHGKQDELAALDRGADDFLSKSSSVRELIARLRRSLRRWTAGNDGQRAPLRTGDLVVDLHARTVTLRGQSVHLTATEFKILEKLALHAGSIVSVEEMQKHVWGAEYVRQRRSLRDCIHNLRYKLEATPDKPRYVLTVRSLGYRMGLE